MTGEVPLQELLEQAQHGHRSAFDEVVTRCDVRLRHWVSCRFGSWLGKGLDADDVVQDALLKAWDAIHRFRWYGEEAFWSWLRTLARRALVDRMRRAPRAAGMQISLEETDEGSANVIAYPREPHGPSPGTALGREERLARLRQAMKNLSQLQRTVVFLTRMRGLPVKEVARRLQRSPNAISMVLLRAIQRLKQDLTAQGGSSNGSLRLPDLGLKEEDFGL